jgi:hypothetical protein
MHETFWTLLRDPAHWEFELFLIAVFDVLIAGILWPFVRVHWRHHIARDKHEADIGMEGRKKDWFLIHPAERHHMLPPEPVSQADGFASSITCSDCACMLYGRCDRHKG